MAVPAKQCPAPVGNAIPSALRCVGIKSIIRHYRPGANQRQLFPHDPACPKPEIWGRRNRAGAACAQGRRRGQNAAVRVGGPRGSAASKRSPGVMARRTVRPCFTSGTTTVVSTGRATAAATMSKGLTAAISTSSSQRTGPRSPFGRGLHKVTSRVKEQKPGVCVDPATASAGGRNENLFRQPRAPPTG
jgi:hypothetical protein